MPERSMLSRLVYSALAGAFATAGCSSPANTAETDSVPVVVDPEAAVVRTYDVVAEEGEVPIGLVTAGPVCGDRIVVPDPRNGVVHVFGLQDGRRLRAIGARGTPNGLRAPESVAVACDSEDLYVLDAGQVVHYKLDSGEFVDIRPRPDNVGLGIGGSGVVEEGEVVFPALWLSHKGALSENAESELLRGAALGYAQSLSGAQSARSVLPLMTESCRNTSSCMRVMLSRVPAPASGWLACQGGGAEVGIFGDGGNRTARIDVASPGFISDGTSAASGGPPTAGIQWLQRNSTAMWCAAVADHAVVVHSTLEKGDWEPGMAMTPVAMMNVYTLSGTPVALDVPIADVPIASDQRSIYVPVYGDARRLGAAQRIQVQQIDIAGDDGVLSPVFRR